ncbi:MAG: response regulator, partial [Clostridiales Family XIII bacterium]|nr:response regulator [Clostridiales Family XIII bacterium]
KRIRDIAYKYLISNETALEGRLFNGVLTLSFVGGFAGFVFTLIQMSSLNAILLTLLLPLVVLLVLFVANRKGNYQIGGIIAIIVFCCIGFPFVFFTGGGIDSGMLAYLLLGTVAISILLKQRYFCVMLAVYLLVCIGCIVLSFFRPELVTPIKRESMVYFDVASSFFISSLLVGISIRYMIREYTNSQRMADNAKRKADEASKAKGVFLSNMSHEMRTPMNAIIGMTMIAKTANDVEKKDYCLAKIEDASNHLLGVINDILDISKIEEGKLELSPVEFDFRDMIEKVKTVNIFRMKEKAQLLTVDIDGRIPDALYADDQHLTQVVSNLMSNAVKFTPENGKIGICAELADRQGDVCTILVRVKDSGIGVSEEQQGVLFHSFQQADSGIARKFGGTGLGLSISKSIVEMMGGKIWLESEIGKGSVFSFTFNAEVREPGTGSTSQTGASANAEESPGDLTAVRVKGDDGHNPPERLRGFTLLLAEDIDINKEIVLSLMEPFGLTIDCADNGREAVEMFRAAPDRYDLILMDIQMPEMSGSEATKRIRALPDAKAKTIPIIAMTANVFREDIEEYLNTGMDDHIGKPIDLQKLLEKLDEYLVQPKRRRT